MSKTKIPESNLAKSMAETFNEKPAVPQRQQPDEENIQSPIINSQDASDAEKEENQGKTAGDKKVKREYVMTYFSDENYEGFEKMYNEVKGWIRRETGTKLKETHVAELAIMLSVEEYERDSEAFFARIKEKLQSWK